MCIMCPCQYGISSSISRRSNIAEEQITEQTKKGFCSKIQITAVGEVREEGQHNAVTEPMT